MKPLLLFAVLLLSGMSSVQELGPSQAIANVIESGAYSGTTDKQLSRMGDAAAVDVAKIVAGRQLSSHEIDGILIVLQLSFSSPQLVSTTSDRQPRATLFVLQYLTLAATDSDVKIRIGQARESIVRATAEPDR
jgi:hypothetical protein